MKHTRCCSYTKQLLFLSYKTLIIFTNDTSIAYKIGLAVYCPYKTGTLSRKYSFTRYKDSDAVNAVLKMFSDRVANIKNSVNVKWTGDRAILYEIVYRLYQLPGRSAITLTLEKYGAL
jgi:hypothetical protein